MLAESAVTLHTFPDRGRVKTEEVDSISFIPTGSITIKERSFAVKSFVPSLQTYGVIECPMEKFYSFLRFMHHEGLTKGDMDMLSVHGRICGTTLDYEINAFMQDFGEIIVIHPLLARWVKDPGDTDGDSIDW